MRDFDSEAHSADFDRVCRHHKVVLPTESYLTLDDSRRLRHIANLQQRNAALESEVQRRRQLEQVLRETLQKRRLVEEELHRREVELRDFLENGLEPMHWVSPTGTILWANRAELDLLGYARDEFVGRSVADFHADRDVIDGILARLQRGEELHNVAARLLCKDGSVRRVLINSNVYWQDGKFVHTRCFTRDITGLTLNES
jgi:PAS domain S-box-containing protein